MNVKNCIKCGKIFNYIGGSVVCPVCKEGLEKEFQKVKTYIRDNPAASVVDVSEACEVSVKQLRQWVREERLAFAHDSAIGIECELCGRTIKTGHYCDQCKAEMKNNLGQAYKKQEQQHEDNFSDRRVEKMRYFNRDR